MIFRGLHKFSLISKWRNKIYSYIRDLDLIKVAEDSTEILIISFETWTLVLKVYEIILSICSQIHKWGIQILQEKCLDKFYLNHPWHPTSISLASVNYFSYLPLICHNLLTWIFDYSNFQYLYQPSILPRLFNL